MSPVVTHFPVQVFDGFKPSDFDGDGVDLGPTGRDCPGYAGDYRPRWGGGFDAPRGPKRLAHRAIDIMAAEGALVVAVAPGVITKVANTPKGGHCLYLVGDDGYVWYYAHMRDAPLVSCGHVDGGMVLGVVGRSGNAVRRTKDGLRGCPHLHLSLTSPKRRKVDSVPFLRPLYDAGGWLRQ